MALPEEKQLVNIFMELSAIGIAQPLSSNILEFLKAIPVCAKERGCVFMTPTEVITKMKSVGDLNVPDTLSWTDEERDVSCWLGNPMQREAFEKLYSVADRVRIANDPKINMDFSYLQASNNFRFMTTKPSNIGLNMGIYSSPFDAFTNYMNILGDFISRVNELYPEEIDNDELNALLTTIKDQDDEITRQEEEIERLRSKLMKLESAEEEKPEAEVKPQEKPAKAKKVAPQKPAAAKKATPKPKKEVVKK